MDHPEPGRADGSDVLPFVAVVQDPGGATYHVQASRSFRRSGPVMLGMRDRPATGGLLGLVNRVLARTARPQQEELFGVVAYREDAGGPTTVLLSGHPDARGAREKAVAVVHAIEQGTFVPD